MTFEFLKNVFEEQLEVFMNDDETGVIIGDTPFSPTQILKADDDAYRVEFSSWLSQRWLPEQMEAVEQQLCIHANRDRYEDLCIALKNENVVPLIGSGMSNPSGLPMWSGFMRRICEHSSLTNEELETLLAEAKYEEAIDQLAASMPSRLFDERIEHDLRINDGMELKGAVQFLPELFCRLLLTTNLDNLLEELFDRRDLRFSEVLAGTRISAYRRLKGKSPRLLLKLHGDCLTQEGRILGVAEYDDAYREGAVVFDELSGIYRNYNILCLGCSLDGDRTVALLGHVASLDPGLPKHYAFLSRPKDPTVLQHREHFLTERNVFPIWYEGDHDTAITSLLVGMAQTTGRF